MPQYNRLSIWMDKKLYETTQDCHLPSYNWVISGAQHRSVLGPLLFFIMMTDIDQAIMTATVGSFADNTRLCQAINAIQGNYTLQQQLQQLYDWVEGKSMHYNGNKFELIRYQW